MQVLLVVAILYVLANLVLVTADADASAQTDLDSAVLVETTAMTSTAPASLFQPLALAPTACHGRVWRRQSVKIKLTGIVVAWRQTAIDRWCGRTGVIYDWGTATGDDGKWAASPYCWYDNTSGKTWWTVSKSEAKVWNQGTLKVCGRVSLGKTINPRIYFHAPSTTRPYPYWNYGGTAIYH
jgi:hypothetical protein